MFSEYFSRLDFEIDGTLYEQGVVVEHPLEVAINELVLDVVAAVVQTTRSNVSRSPLQTVSL